MVRFRGFVLGLSLFGAICVGMSILRADEDPAAVPPQVVPEVDRVAQLITRIEKLEARIKALEMNNERATRQVNSVYVPSPQYFPMPVPSDQPPVEVARPKPRFLLLNGKN